MCAQELQSPHSHRAHMMHKNMSESSMISVDGDMTDNSQSAATTSPPYPLTTGDSGRALMPI
jgi:hypothetical protein